VKTLFATLERAKGWVAAQFALTLLLLLLGLAWNGLPADHLWQVALGLLVFVLLAISALELQAGTVRAFATDDGRRVKLVWGAAALLVWVALGAATWALLDWIDDQIPLWASLLAAKTGAHGPATVFTYERLQRAMTAIEWILRWVVAPAKLIPYGAASAQWGWRLPWRMIVRFLWNWRWWLGVLAAALTGVWLPSQFFTAAPMETASAQLWTVGLKLAGAYLLAVSSWVLVLAWWAALFSPQHQEPPAEEAFSAVPVLSGPAGRERGATAEIPPSGDDFPA
jgi:hypothetical protein